MIVLKELAGVTWDKEKKVYFVNFRVLLFGLVLLRIFPFTPRGKRLTECGCQAARKSIHPVPCMPIRLVNKWNASASEWINSDRLT